MIDAIFGSRALQVVAGGIEENGFGIRSDHCLQWVDIDKDTTLLTAKDVEISHKARRLQAKDPRIRTRYLKILKEEMERKGLWDRTFRLERQCVQQLDDEQAM